MEHDSLGIAFGNKSIWDQFFLAGINNLVLLAEQELLNRLNIFDCISIVPPPCNFDLYFHKRMNTTNIKYFEHTLLTPFTILVQWVYPKIIKHMLNHIQLWNNGPHHLSLRTTNELYCMSNDNHNFLFAIIILLQQQVSMK